MSDVFDFGFNVGDVLALYTELGAQVADQHSPLDAFLGVTRVAVSAVHGTAFASITRDRRDHFQTLAPSAVTATEADRLQYQLGTGPCLDCVRDAGTPTPLVSDDISVDLRWPIFGPRVFSQYGVSSMLSVRLVIAEDVRVALNLYSLQLGAFDVQAQATALLLATHAGVILNGVLAQERVENTERALQSSRQIGMAVGVLMSTKRLTSDQAFDVLRIASQRANRRVSHIADQVIEAGELTS